MPSRNLRRRLMAATTPTVTAAAQVTQVGIQSPSAFNPSPTTLQSVVWADLTGQPGPMNRASVIGIPALARQRHLLCGTAAGCPLQVLTGDTPVVQAESHWSTRTDGAVSPWHRMLWTIDDLIFHGWSVWSAVRGYAPAGSTLGPLLHAVRISADRWSVDNVGRILIDDKPANSADVIAIPGPHEGILNMAPTALKRTLDNLEAAANAARNPSAYLELHYTGDAELTDDEIDKLVGRWAAARRGEHGGVAFTNKVLEVKEHGTHEAHLLIEGRNADAVDMSRLVSSPAAMADATAAGASLTYETTQGRNAQFVDYGAGIYMDAVAARLSMDDVVPRGQRVAFDTSDLRALTPSPTGEATAD